MEYSFVGRLPKTEAHSPSKDTIEKVIDNVIDNVEGSVIESRMGKLFRVPFQKELSSSLLTKAGWEEIRKCAKQNKATLIVLDDGHLSSRYPIHHQAYIDNDSNRNILYATLDIEYNLLKQFF